MLIAEPADELAPNVAVLLAALFAADCAIANRSPLETTADNLSTDRIGLRKLDKVLVTTALLPVR